MAGTRHWLRLGTGRAWDDGRGLLAVLLLGASIAIGVVHHVVDAPKTRAMTPDVGTITAIRTGTSKYRPGLISLVYAQDATGLVGFAIAYPMDISGCEVGDEIRESGWESRSSLSPRHVRCGPAPHDHDAAADFL